MRDRFPTLIALLLLLVLVAGTWWAADYAQRSIAVDPPRRLTHEMDSWSRNFVMLRTDPAGIPINRLEGDYLQHFPDDDSYDIETPRAFGVQPDTPVTVATSKTATMDKGGSRMVMNGDAHVHRKADAERDALDVRSQSLTVLPDDNVVETALPAQVTQGRSVMNGTGMHYDNNSRQLQVFSSSDVTIDGAQTRRRNATTLPPSTPRQP